MNRRAILSMTVALASAAVLSTVALPAHAAGGTSGCSIQPYGLIGARWAQLGGENGRLGCPTTSESDIYQNNVGWAGRRQTFARGQMAWSPKNGPNLVVAAWSDNGYAYFDWRATARAFDKFLVRWASAADPNGAQEDFIGGVRGRAHTRLRTNGGYRWNVKGCDTGVFGSNCQKTWTISVTG
ncbi:LGFP repeat-containing protein [Streptosporangium pseudovulgare]|uniref:LGFP repeat-containing protein n=1 Tax=Streptosporangium pseudovulgare TaxID=35765 RepID=A0ABQ2QX02_9ACTN|nr:hypothetical protein [Streptosporangium pseudovulgare]GGQ00296.1 hypothetical protein GCM10010140_32960 [Streptosporangium pseudovulgare]